MDAPTTNEKYRGRLAKFFDFNSLTEGTMERAPRPFSDSVWEMEGSSRRRWASQLMKSRPNLYALKVKDARDDSQSTYSICVLLVPWRIGKEIKSRMNR
jgi:hypothetical protein